MFRCIVVLSLLSYMVFTTSCSKEEKLENTNYEFDLKTSVTVQDNTYLVSSLFFKMGVTNIIVKPDNGSYKYSCNAQKVFYFNGDLINLSDYELELKNDFLSISGVDSYMVSLVNGLPYIITPEYKGLLHDAEDIVFDNALFILLLYMNEITLSENKKGDFMIEKIDIKRCSFWDTYYVFGMGLSSSTSADRLESEIDNHNMGSCSPIGSTDTSCIWGSHGCISTQAFCCE